MSTVKQVLRTNTKEEWMNNWTKGKTGRSVFKHMNKPNPRDSINSLTRKDQVAIFRLRTQHVPLNKHLNRVNPQRWSACPLCNHAYEKTTRHLFECRPLSDLRAVYLPPNPSISNSLYTSSDQLRKTCIYHNMALARRAKAQLSLDR